MKQDQEKAPDNLVMAIIIHLYIGWGFLYLLKSAVGHLMNNAYLGLIPALIIMLPFVWLAFDLAKMYPNKSITAILGQVFGQLAGKILGITLLVYLVFFEAIALRYSKLMVYSYFFERTPFFLITGVFIACTLYLALKGVKSVGRLAAFMLFPPLLAIFILELFGLANVNLLNVRPVFAGTLGQWFAATLDLPLVLLPGTAIFYYMPFLKQPKNIKKISLVCLSIVIPLFFLALLGTIGTFGPSLTQKMSWSVVEFFHIIDYPYLLLEQAGLFFLIAWLPFHFVAVSQGLFIIGNDLNIIFPKIKRNWFIIIVSVLIFAAVNIPLNIVYLANFLHHYQGILTFSFLSLLFSTWVIARLRYKICLH